MNREWCSAIEIRAGDILKLANGKTAIVSKVYSEALSSPVTVYNFEVEDYHTYYVGEDSVLVHNWCKKERIVNVSKYDSKVWKNLKNHRNGIKKSVSGKKTLYYTWDDLHNEIEVFDDLGKHIGVLDPKTGKFIKKAVKGRKIKL